MQSLRRGFQLVALRHGESAWNLENKFAGWTDVPLSEKGVGEAREAGALLRREGLEFDAVFTSVLRRSIDTYYHLSTVLGCQHLPHLKSWRLNERHYGALTGLDKAETLRQHGEEKVKLWRRSYSVPPPPLAADDPRAPALDPIYAHVPPAILPLSESLETTSLRTLPYFYDAVWPELRAGRRVLIVAHGNSLRAIHKQLTGMSEKEIAEFNLPTAVPVLYRLDAHARLESCAFLGDQEEIRRKMDAVANPARSPAKP